MGSIPAGHWTLCCPSAILRGTEPVSALTQWHACFYNWIASVSILRWQGFNSWHEHPTSTRQFPEVYDLCHTFWHVARVKKTPTCENHTRNLEPPSPFSPAALVGHCLSWLWRSKSSCSLEGLYLFSQQVSPPLGLLPPRNAPLLAGDSNSDAWKVGIVYNLNFMLYTTFAI